jgi:hypothetical protein
MLEMASIMDVIRAFLNRHLFITIQGMTFPTWARLLVFHRGRVHPMYLPRALMLTFTSLLNTVYAAFDLVLFAIFARRARVEAPIFILGHFRSGTTHLHNLLALDRRFAFPTLYQTLNPDTFLSTEALFRLPTRLLLTRHRPQDNMAIDPTVPAEDEVALAIGSGLSPYIGWVFPRDRDATDRLLTLEGAPPRDLDRWRVCLRSFLQKLSWKYNRPLILKSPPHTARIRLLLGLFPDARFIHIHRDPFEVFQSTQRLIEKLPPYFALQPLDLSDMDDRILDGYERMYKAFFAQRDDVPRGQFHEVAFSDLERDPIGTLARVYEALGLGGFEEARPALDRYVASQRSYRKNTHPNLPGPLRERIVDRWRFAFEAWGYPTQTPACRAPHVMCHVAASRSRTTTA